MHDSARAKSLWFVCDAAGREVFFPPQIPFIRGFFVHCRPQRRALEKRMESLDSWLLGLLCAALLVGWTMQLIGVCLSLWLTASEVIYWLGTRRFVRRMRPLPLRASLRLYTSRMSSEDLCAGVYLAAILGLIVAGYGAVSGDIALVALGALMLIWSCRLLGVLVYRWARKWQSAV